ncbi:MAG: family 43 glycosylhydrolase [Bacteroidales bacterium]|jgi:hypothetical protein|nr:family 43 glycosylhydrolase [Bacteroidales bacterium]
MPHHPFSLLRVTILCLTFVLAGNALTGTAFAANDKVVIPPAQVSGIPSTLKCHDFYKKYVDADGIPIIASERVRDEALLVARTIILEMLYKRADVKQALVEKGSRIMIVGEHEGVCELPEYAQMCDTEESRKYWNWRARGFGGSPESDYSCSFGEENVLALEGDRYEGESILVHEFAHMYQIGGMPIAIPGINDKLEALYQKAKEKGLWANTYAMDNKEEYFAEAVQSFFNTNRYAATPNGVHGPVDTREKLKKYDPAMYKFLCQFFDEDMELSLRNKTLALDPKPWFNSPGATNPLVPSFAANPSVRRFGNTYYLYGTGQTPAGATSTLQAWTSSDFVNWALVPMKGNVPVNAWSPDVVQGPDGQNYLYACEADKMTMAYGATPIGPWTLMFGEQGGIPGTSTRENGTKPLNGKAFFDDDGNAYFYWATWEKATGYQCHVMEVNLKTGRPGSTRVIPADQLKDFLESPFVFKREGRYYLLYTAADPAGTGTIIRYATSHQPFGPFESADANVLLTGQSNSRVLSPGHPSVIKEGNDFLLVYHRQALPAQSSHSAFQPAVDKILFESDGHIKPVIPTHKGLGFLQPSSVTSTDLASDKRVNASSVFSQDFISRYITDNNNATRWLAANAQPGQWVEVDLQAVLPITDVWIQFEQPSLFYQYLIETSVDAKNWVIFADRRTNRETGSPMKDRKSVTTRYVRVTFTGGQINHSLPGIWNIQVFKTDQPQP